MSAGRSWSQFIRLLHKNGLSSTAAAGGTAGRGGAGENLLPATPEKPLKRKNLPPAFAISHPILPAFIGAGSGGHPVPLLAGLKTLYIMADRWNNDLPLAAWVILG